MSFFFSLSQSDNEVRQRGSEGRGQQRYEQRVEGDQRETRRRPEGDPAPRVTRSVTQGELPLSSSTHTTGGVGALGLV